MNDQGQPLDQRIRAALTEGMPEHAPDTLLRSIMDATDDLPQRRRSGWTWLIASGAMAGAGAVVLIIAFFAGFWHLGPSQNQPGASLPTAGASVAVPSIPVDGSCQPDSSCLGILPPGNASTRVLSPSLLFQVPAGWMNRVDQGGVFELRPLDRPQDLIGIYGHPEAVQAGRKVAGVPERADALIAFLQQDPEVTVISVHQVTVGGLAGMVADLVPAESAAKASLDCPGARCVTILSGIDPGERPVWSYRTVLPADSRTRIYLLDSQNGVVLVEVTAWNTTTFDDLLARSEPIIQSFRFSR